MPTTDIKVCSPDRPSCQDQSHSQQSQFLLQSLNAARCTTCPVRNQLTFMDPHAALLSVHKPLQPLPIEDIP